MFDIEYKGGNAVVITTKKIKVMVDPKLSVLGLKDPATKEALIVATDPQLAIHSDDSLLVIDGPGEYEASDVSIRAIAADKYGTAKGSKELTMYRLELGDVRLAVLGNVAPDLDESQLEALGVIDLLILPVGGGGTLNATQAAQLARTIDVKAVIPVQYADSALKYIEDQDSIEVFKKEFGGELEQVSKYKVKSSATIPAVSTIIEITRS
jgi:L-ascorbate metabolism protein UlaG (beta-lactamase superfamily)